MATESTHLGTPGQRDLLRERLRAAVVAAGTLADIDAAGRGGGTVVPREPADRIQPPLSFAQERLWFMEQLAPGTPAYTVPVVWRIRGALDAGLLAEAVRAIVRRHDSLRTCFPTGPDGTPTAVVTAEPRLDWSESAVDTLPVDEREPRARELVLRTLSGLFDLAGGPLLRVLLVRLEDSHHVLAVAAHHTVSDGWSTDVFRSELATLYRGLRTGVTTDLPHLPVRYGDYAQWQRERLTAGPLADRELAYWREHLAELPPLRLPVDRPRPVRQSFGGAAHSFAFTPAIARAVTELAGRCGATKYMVLLAAFDALLWRYSGQTDFAVGCPVAGRERLELEPLIGMFVNLLPLRARPDPGMRFDDLLGATRACVLEALGHQELPFERLVTQLGVERDVSRPPLVQVICSLHNYRGPAAARRDGADGGDDLEFSAFPIPTTVTTYELELHLTEGDDWLGASFVYNTDLFDAATIERMAANYAALLTAVLADPLLRLRDLPVPAPDERSTLERFSTGPRVAIDDGRTIVDLIEEQPAGAVALVYEGATISYGELNRRADRVARRLVDSGVRRGDRVAVLAQRSPELVTALLAVLKAGAGYVPLDPEHPAQRRAYTIEDAAVRVVLTQRAFVAGLPAGPVVLPLEDPGTEAEAATVPTDQRPRPGDVAYTIYTSGSTGRPKGVQVEHRALSNRLDWMQRQFRLDGDDVVLQKTSAGFDVSVWEFFWPLSTGARLVLARPGGHRDPTYLRDLIVAERVTTVHFVPSMLAEFLAEDGVERCRSLRRIVASGEELPLPVAARCVATLPAQLFNLYGPTEATVDVSWWHCAPDELSRLAKVPIGVPIQNIDLHVLDADLRVVPVGAVGELCIGGVGLARGYLGLPDLTAQRFVPHPFGPPGSRLYRTGDLARWGADGRLEFLGRADTQVKLRGHRIELGEIESVLLDQPAIAQAVVTVHDGTELVAYLVPDRKAGGGAALSVGAVRAALAASLPAAMLPHAFVVLDQVPLTANGKVDHARLPAAGRSRDETVAFVAPASGTETAVATVWREVLDAHPVGARDNFFELGGDSIRSLRVVSRLRALGYQVSVQDLFLAPTVHALSLRLGPPPAAAVSAPGADCAGAFRLLSAADRARLTARGQGESR